MLLVDSVTMITPSAHGQVVVTGSHGGLNVAIYAARAGISALVANDGGRGREDAGVRGISELDNLRIPAVAVDCFSSRIGDADDTLSSGVVSYVNQTAEILGVKIGMSADDVTRVFQAEMQNGKSHQITESSHEIWKVQPRTPQIVDLNGIRVLVADSASQLKEYEDIGILVSGSHGGAVAGKAVCYAVRAAVFNDAGVGKDDAGISRLAILQDLGIAGLTVSHQSCRIGDGRDSLERGIVSFINQTARTMGAEVAMSLNDALNSLSAGLKMKGD